MNRLPDLRDHVRDEVLSAATAVVRGGPDAATKLVAHAERFGRAFVLDGDPVLGISVFAAVDDVGPCSVDGILGSKMATYRVVHVVGVELLVAAGFILLATFERPHVTIVLSHIDEVETLLSVLGPGRANPRYGGVQRRVRRRPS